MADTKISAGADPVTLVATDKLPLARSASTTAYAATVAEIATYANTAYVPNYSASTPTMDGAGAAGTAATVSRGDHQHVVDTSRYAASNPAGYQTAAQVTTALASYAPLASPVFTGTPSLPAGTIGVTAAPGDNDTSVATTAFVTAAVAGATAGVASFNTRTGTVTLTNADVVTVLPASSTTPAMNGTAAIGVGTTWARADHVHGTDTSRAPTASPTFSGFLANPGTARFGPGVAIAANTASLIVDNSSGLALAVECSNNAPAAVGLMVRNDRTDGAAITFFFGSSSQVGSIAQNGTTTAYNTSSDYRLKNLYGTVDESQAGAMIDAVPVYRAGFKSFPEREPYPMFLAHELAAQCPWAVSGEKDAVVGADDPMGREAGDIAPQQVNHSSLVAVLWAEVQSLRRRLAVLESTP